MNKLLSNVIFGISWCLIAVTVVLSWVWLRTVLELNGILALDFVYRVAPFIAGVSLLLAITSRIMFSIGSHKRALMSFRISLAAAVLLLLEALVLFVMLRVGVRFGGPGG